jgi:hypothetical protein
MANETTENNISGLNSIPVTAPTSKTALTPKGTLALDPTQTQSILENMQRMIDQRESAFSLFTGGLKDAAAWASGGLEGPTRGLAARDEQKAREAKELFDMRTQMASYKAAQSQQQAFEKRRAMELGGGEGGASGAGAAPAVGGIQIPAEIKRALSNARTQEDYDKIYNTWAQKQSEISSNVEMDVPKVPVVVQNPDGSFTRKVISVREYRANPNLYKDTPETQSSLKSTTPAASPEGDTRAKIKQGVFSTESSSGKADTTKPGIQGAVGPMQITADTWATNVSRGVIPKDLDINNPQHNKIAGEKILDYYYDKYNGDVDKTLAAYHGGEGAINSDGTINRERKDQLGTSIGDYITKTKAAMGTTTAPTPAVAAKGPRPTPEQLEAESRVKSTFREQQAKGAAENVQKSQLSFETITEPSSVSERKTSAERVEKLVLDNPTAAGIIAKPGVTNAILTILRDGLNTPSGAIGIKTIEDALVLTMPGTDQKTINARREIAQNLAKGALEASKLSQGQGSVSDFERSMFERIAGSLADTPELLVKRQRMLVARANLDSELGKMYRSTKKPGEPLDFDVFRTSKEYENKVAVYEKELRGILDSEVQIKGVATASKHPGASVIKKYPPRTTP